MEVEVAGATVEIPLELMVDRVAVDMVEMLVEDMGMVDNKALAWCHLGIPMGTAFPVQVQVRVPLQVLVLVGRAVVVTREDLDRGVLWPTLQLVAMVDRVDLLVDHRDIAQEGAMVDTDRELALVDQVAGLLAVQPDMLQVAAMVDLLDLLEIPVATKAHGRKVAQVADMEDLRVVVESAGDTAEDTVVESRKRLLLQSTWIDRSHLIQ